MATATGYRRRSPTSFAGRHSAIAAAMAAALSLCGCQSAVETPSGRPEATFQGIKADRLKPQIVHAMINARAVLKSDSAYQLTFERPWGNQVGSAFVGALLSTDASPAIERLTFSIADTPTGSRVVLDRAMVKRGAFGREDASAAGRANLPLRPNPLFTICDYSV